jgi:hypothetical protein
MMQHSLRVYLFVDVTLCYVMLCYVTLRYVMLCYVTLCYVMLCYVMLCYGGNRVLSSEVEWWPPRYDITSTITFIECYKGDTRVLHECYKSVTRELQECYKSVTRVLQGSCTSSSTQCYERERDVPACWSPKFSFCSL